MSSHHRSQSARKLAVSTKLLVAYAASLLAATTAHSAIVYSQNFESLTASPGGTALSGQGGFAADASVKVYDGGGVTYTGTGGSVPGGNNMVSLNQSTGASNGNYAGTTFSAQSGANLYFSFTYNYKNANIATDTGADFFRLQFSNGTSATTTDYLGIQVQGGTAANQTNYLMTRGRSATNNPGVVTATAPTFTANGTVAYLVSGQLTWNATSSRYDAITLWLNPTSTATVPTSGQYLGTQSSSMTGSTLSTISALVFQNGTTPDNLDTGDFMKVDNLRVGTAWADVSVPEPAAAALCGIGLLAVSRRRRVQRAAKE